MKTNILHKYSLKFVNIEIYGEKWKHCSANDNTTQTTLGCFLSCLKKSQKVERLLLEVADVLIGNSTDIATGCDTVLVDVYKDKTEFYDISAKQHFHTADFIMPTQDFKVLLKEWQRFVEMPAVFDNESVVIEIS